VTERKRCERRSVGVQGVSENPVVTFPIKKKIKIELFIDRKQGLYIQ